jgi:hypothetical protein
LRGKASKTGEKNDPDFQVKRQAADNWAALLKCRSTLKEELGYIRMLGLPGVESIKVNLNDDTFVPLRLSDRPESGFHPNKKDKSEQSSRFAGGKKVIALCKKLLDPAATVSRQRVVLDCLKTIGKTAPLDALQQFILEGLAKNRDVASRAEEVLLALGGQPYVDQATTSAGEKNTSYRNPNEENAEYILIPGGNYRYSVTEETVDVPDLYVAKYPVINRLYRSFIAAVANMRSNKLSGRVGHARQANTRNLLCSLRMGGGTVV